MEHALAGMGCLQGHRQISPAAVEGHAQINQAIDAGGGMGSQVFYRIPFAEPGPGAQGIFHM